ncbi:hypothetical protein QL285_026061 [Trifolium repens]|nr:hypothetical protein QL285_026061 [Trifolium repens]
MGLDDGFGVDTNDETRNENNMRLVLSSIEVSESESKFEDDEYESEELGSSDPDASDEERGVRYEKFRKDQMSKKYKFKFGMEFNSLQDFRDAIRDHNVRNGYQVTSVKNEGSRVRVVYGKGCPYRVLCSQVSKERAFAIKTQDKYMVHTCLKSLTNKSVNSKWVSKEVVKLMHTSQKVMIRDIVQHMRTKFALNITPSTTWKAKQYTTAIVEGDTDRQYSLLRRYAEELRSKCKHNTVKIGVEKPIPSS